MIHHTFRKGQKVHTILNNGNIIIGKFVQCSSRFLTLDVNGDITKIKWKDIRSSNINVLKSN